LDELVDGLDEDSQKTFTQAILSPALPWTVVVASRDPAITNCCSHIISLGASRASADNPS
jgi:ABC-type bacteriocin/lantibiotic exporter with double-glycine peptidase domain